MKIRRPHISSLLMLTLCGLCVAQDNAPPAHARATLVSDTSAIVPGKPFTIAVVFDIDPGWHLYWKEPGDSGMPPMVKWTLPDGFKAGELQFPKPEVLKSSSGVNYVYEKELALLVTVTPPADLKPGQEIDIKADIKWLECTADQCLPAKQLAELRVKTDTAAQPADEDRFIAWRAAVKAGENFDPTQVDQ